jgi:hypothetical protein
MNGRKRKSHRSIKDRQVCGTRTYLTMDSDEFCWSVRTLPIGARTNAGENDRPPWRPG